jgi:ubiquinone/menaquinone biosynthesis C-methylase UbiE
MSWNAGDFDRWYAQMGRSGLRDQIARRALGLPSDMDASGLLPWAAVTEVAAALNLAPGQLLVDLGCGRGGYGLEIARQTGARLLGLDFSPVAVTAAASRAASADIAGPAGFCVGDMTAPGVGTDAADAVVCIETIMFVGAHLDALRECRRMLAAGGRLVVTTWEATNLADQRLPQWARRIDLTRDLWASAIQADAAGDPAIESLHEEARRALDLFDSSRRVCATAIAPG